MSSGLDQEILSTIGTVSRQNLELNVNNLSSFYTRHSKSSCINKAAEWLLEKLKDMGYGQAMFHSYREKIDDMEYDLKNVICNKKGNNAKTIMICAHYDCRMENLKDSGSRAPGANDNASGVSAVLEIARVLAKQNLELSLQFVFFSGEEQGLLGSKNYVKHVRDSGVDLYCMINLDMVGCPQLNPGAVIIERDNNVNPEHNRAKENDQKSMELGEIMKDMSYCINLPCSLDSIYDSDYEPFEAEGYVVIGAYDGSARTSNPHYHSSSDLPSLIDWDYLTTVTKMVLATIIKISNIA
jgi:Zn-dependent M28 family amino/carboxypeptidase